MHANVWSLPGPRKGRPRRVCACCVQVAYLLHPINKQPHMASLPEHDMHAVEQPGTSLVCILEGQAANGRRFDQIITSKAPIVKAPLEIHMRKAFPV